MEENTTQNFFQKNKTLVIIGVVVLLLVFWAVGKYNTFVTQNQAITAQWAQVENQFQRRFDLIPNFVETVKGAAKQETAVFTAIADARTHYAGATTQDAKVAAAGEVQSALARLLVITENYPELKSIQAYRDLTVELEGTENRISVERMKYNDIVKTYNNSVITFPSSLLAKLFGMGQHAYFEAVTEAKTAPKVQF